MSELTDAWPTQQEAADTLQISTKTIERYAQEGKIEMRKRPRPGRKAENVCNPTDIERLLPAAHVMPAQGQQIALRKAPPALLPDWDAALARISTMLTGQKDTVEIHRKIWLTLEEAQAYSGRSRAWLLRLCRYGELIAEKDRGWKIRRGSLEQYNGALPEKGTAGAKVMKAVR